jgi:hypothetical protein
VYGGPSTSAILLYQSSWRHRRHHLLPILTAAAYNQLLTPTSPTSAPSCFSLSNRVGSSSGTPTYAVNLRVVPPPHLRLRGAWRSLVYGSTYLSSGAPTFEVHEQVLSRTSITIPFPSTTWPSGTKDLTPSSGTPNTSPHLFLHIMGPVLIFILTPTYNNTISIRYLAHVRH